MLRLVLCLLLLFLGLINSTLVTQKPFVTAEAGDEAELMCIQNGSDDWMYWYQQLPDSAALSLLFFSRSEVVGV
ncbi:hypothetical protein GN956_G10594 [Arapaima gigas]